MRLVELSNHPRGLLRDIQARERMDQPPRRRSLWAWIRGIFARGERRRPPRRSPAAGVPSGREESIAAGMAGEQRLTTELGSVLGNEWVLFRGYRNSRGEIDHLLLGPRGVFAIEVKYHNATVYVRDDTWLFDKFDRYGNRVEHGRVEDRTGRSPSVQLNEPADDLQRFLRSRGQLVSVARIVILNHPRSRVGGQRNTTVHVVTSSRQIIDLVAKSRFELSDERIVQVASLIERDHRFHDARRQSR